MKNWKKVSTFLLALSMSVSFAIGFAACGGNEGETSSKSSNVTESSSVDNSVEEVESSLEEVESNEFESRNGIRSRS